MADFRKEFPDYPEADMPTLPEGFVDTSWINNSAPSFESKALGLSIWIDYLDPANREHEGERFLINEIDADGAFKNDEPDLATDDWSEVLAFIASRS